jgi:PTS system mannose-specific IIA component
MVGLVVAAHGQLAAELIATAEQIVGGLSQVASCSVAPGTAPEELRLQLRQAVKNVDGGEGVIIFADLIGGSPCMQSLSLCQQAKLEVITGVNLPMLLKANSLRATVGGGALPLRDLAHELAVYGQRTITCATDAVRKATTPTGEPAAA